MNRAQFLAASEAAGRWLKNLAFVVSVGSYKGKLLARSSKRAYELFFTKGDGENPPVVEEYGKYLGALKEVRLSITAVSDGRLKWRWGNERLIPAYWSSAHEAVVELTSDALVILIPGMESVRDRPGCVVDCSRHLRRLTYANAGKLQERVRRERAKVAEKLDAYTNVHSGSSKNASGKRGRKRNPEQDKRIYDEYYGDDAPWVGQVAYLKDKHPARYKRNSNAAKAWLSTLLKREGNRRTSEM